MVRTDLDLTDEECQALHDLKLGAEHVQRAYGHLLAFHHAIGRGMDHFAAAEAELREAGHLDPADELRDNHLPAGVLGDRWSYELVEEFQAGFLADVVAFESVVRDDLAAGVDHVAEREQQRRWRERARR